MSPLGLIDQLSAFSSSLRGRGLVVTPDQTSDMARALTLIDLACEKIRHRIIGREALR